MINSNSWIKYFLIGLIAGTLVTLAGGAAKRGFLFKCYEKMDSLLAGRDFTVSLPKKIFRTKHGEDFSKSIEVKNGGSFGPDGFLTFELYRGGTFSIPGNGWAEQKSNSYRDSAFIRSTAPLPDTYKISVVVGGIDYGLENIAGLPPDPEYPEGPQNENGCYLLAITDELPAGHHTNTWWHQHRKAVIDVDNNVWGHGMPNPVFMVYFDRANKLHSLDAGTGKWTDQWLSAFNYNPQDWYKVEIEKTNRQFILSLYNEKGRLLKRGSVNLPDVWQEDSSGHDYLVVGDPHENYYQGSMKIRAIAVVY